MSDLQPRFTVSNDLGHNEVHFSVSGFWKEDTAASFIREISAASAPLIASGKPFRVLGDLSAMVTQDRQIADILRRTLARSQQAGMERIAIVTQSQLVRLQYKRVSERITVEFFDGKIDALHWLRT